LRGTPIPVIAVLGNHDYHEGVDAEITAVLEDAGVTVLEGTTTTLKCRGRTLGVAGVKGLESGFAGACGSEFGEREMKAYVRHAKEKARVLEDARRSRRTEGRIARPDYVPVRDTLEGE